MPSLLRAACCLSLLFYLLGVEASGGDEWEYTGVEQGPTHWYEFYPECGGQRQSPIDIEPTKVIGLPPFDYEDWEVKYDILLKNNGHTVFANLPQQTSLSGGGLEGTYRPLQFHFHWGINSDVGSEHQISGRRYPLEVHIVHYKEAFNGSFGEAMSDGDGDVGAVIGFMFQISKENNTALQPLIDHLKDVIDIDGNTTVTDFSLDTLLPREVREGPFYRYLGSLTTPPCSEKIVWTMLTNKVDISERQMEEFRMLEDLKHLSIHDNWRPHQELHGRDVFASEASIAPRLNLAQQGGNTGVAAQATIPSLCTVLIAAMMLLA